MGAAGDPLGVPWWVMVVGEGLCAAPAYWCTDFLLVQRAMAARDLASARKTPLVAALPKMLFPAVVTMQGMIALAIAPAVVEHDYNLALPALMSTFYGPGMLGLGITALLASFMSGMAGNVTAFNTVFTYDIYQTYLVKQKQDSHYLIVGKIATIAGALLACASSFIVLRFNNLMDYMTMVAGLFISPFFIVFLLGMFWKRPSATAGFYGMLAGIAGTVTEYLLYNARVIHLASPMAATLWAAVWGLVAGFVAVIAISSISEPPDAASLRGLVLSRHESDDVEERHLPWFRRPAFYAAVVLAAFAALNIFYF